MAEPERVPDPPDKLHITPITWPAGRPLHRVHAVRFKASEFNASGMGNARFSPIDDAHGRIVPTLYGGNTLHCALMETALRDVPFVAGLKTFDQSRLQHLVHSVLVPTQDLILADLHSKPLRKLGVERSQLIDTEADTYPRTRRWAAAIHEQAADMQGLLWVSRQDDGGEAIVLFGDRVDPQALEQRGSTRELLADTACYAELLELADLIGVCLIDGRKG